ncbi:MAG: DUF998 domain-containing protein [Microbacteriaceae bacterium]
MAAFLTRALVRLHAMALFVPAPRRRGDNRAGPGVSVNSAPADAGVCVPPRAPADAGAGTRTVAGRSALTLGALAALAGIIVIWVARASIHRPIYVSELGAQRMPTATAFAVALLLIAAGGAVIAVTGRHPRVGRRMVVAWPIGATIAVSSLCFVVAAQVTCTETCPVPFVNPAAAPQDFIHISAAVLGFAAGCVAMVQVAVTHGNPILARVSLAAGLLVGAITIVGGLLAILHRDVDVGASLEFSATTLAVTWLAGYGLWLAHRRLPDAATPDAATPDAVETA